MVGRESGGLRDCSRILEILRSPIKKSVAPSRIGVNVFTYADSCSKPQFGRLCRGCIEPAIQFSPRTGSAGEPSQPI